MDFSASLCVLCLIPFLVLQGAVAQNQGPPQCVVNMMQKPEFVECMQGFVNFLKNAGQAGGGGPPNGGEATMQLMCSPEGKVAMTCMLQYVQDCPEISQQTGGMDLNSFIQQGGMDAVCGMLSGPCMSVQECIEPDAMSGGITVIPQNGNPFAIFYQQSVQACGPMKKQYDCMMKHMAECEAQVMEMEKAMTNAIKASVSPDNAFVSFEEFKNFMTSTCKNVPRSYTKDGCVMTALTKDKYFKCYQDAKNTYSTKQEEKCSLYDLQSTCLNMHVGKDCGEDSAKFMKSNMNLVIKNVPASCVVQKDTSAANKNVHLAATTAVMLAVAMFVVV